MLTSGVLTLILILVLAESSLSNCIILAAIVAFSALSFGISYFSSLA